MRRYYEDNPEDLLDAKRLRYARRSDRIRSYSHDLQQTDRIIEGRGRYFERIGVTKENDPGGLLTGLVRTRRRLVGRGASAEIETDYIVDIAILRERLVIAGQIAREVGNVYRAPSRSDPVTITIAVKTPTDHECIPS